jgi:hypothetical protein
MKLRTLAFWLIASLGILAAPPIVEACHDGSPLILDLNGDGIRTVDANHSVSFDIDADGTLDKVNWTFWESDEGFLALDRNGNGTIDDGGELFGDATLLPTGQRAENGFEALAPYDQLALGGDGDGVLTEADAIWRRLRTWIDGNQDGISQPQELSPLARWGVLGMGLEFVESDELDGNGNRHLLKGHYLRRVADHGPAEVREFEMHDVFFKIVHQD